MDNQNKNNVGVWITIGVILIIIAIGWLVSDYWKPKSSSLPPPSSMAAAPVSLQNELENGTYNLYGDTFTLQNGTSTIQGHGFSASDSTLVPIGYTYAASGSGDLTGTGEEGSVVAMYRSFGADLEWVALFAMTNTGSGSAPSLSQIASGIAYEYDSKIQSVSVANGVITLNLLTVNQADQQNLPHYEQVPNQPETLTFKIAGDQIVQTTSSASSGTKG